MTDAAQRWDERYRSRDYPTEPAGLLEEISHLLPSTGTVLDVAGGGGRNAIWLARRGLDVTVADVSAEGLKLASSRAAMDATDITTILVDLEHAPLPSGPWTVIVVIHYLQRSLFADMVASLVPGGLLIAEIATVRNLERHERPPLSFLLGEGELTSLAGDLEVLHYREGWDANDRHSAQLVGRRPPLDGAIA